MNTAHTAHSFPEPSHSHHVRKPRPRNKKKKRPKGTVVEGLMGRFELSHKTRTKVWKTYRRLWKSPEARKEVKYFANRDIDPRTLLFVYAMGIVHAKSEPESLRKYIRKLVVRLELLLSISYQSPVDAWRKSFISSTEGDMYLFLDRFGPKK